MITCVAEDGFADGVKAYVFNNKWVIIKNAIIAVAAIFVLFCIANTLGLFSSKEGQFTTSSESSLEKIIKTSELSTLEYIYNSYATVYDKKDKPMYYVAYEGNVKIGIDLSDANLTIDDDNKKIIVTISEPKIQDVTVDIESLDFIFKKQKYETETILSEAHNECVKDLNNKLKNNDTIFDMAKENAVSAVKALLEPLTKRTYNGFIIEVK